MRELSNNPQALIVVATQHRIAADILLLCSQGDRQGNQKLPVRAVICEQYAKSIRLALESFVAQKELNPFSRRQEMTLHELFLYCESHGLELQDTPDFSTENFETLLIAFAEGSNYKFFPRNAAYTADLVWPKLYAAHLIEVVRSVVAGAVSDLPGFAFSTGQPGQACFAA